MTGRTDFLLEIGCEEIPARMLARAEGDFASLVTGLLDGAGLAHGEAEPFSTPRRLAVRVGAVQTRQEDRQETLTGPPYDAAFSADGSPTKAAAGFARKVGAAVEDLERVSTERGEYLGIRRNAPGRTLAEILAEGLPGAVAAMSFPKMMRWGDGRRRFVRPVHWVVALLGEQIVPLEILGVPAGRDSSGHRILGSRRFPIASASVYESALLAEGVTARRAARREALTRVLLDLCGSRGVSLVKDDDLLEEVADLVEYPGAVAGAFPSGFLTLPREILSTTLRHHQKSFATESAREGESGSLANVFLCVADTDRDSGGHVRSGNEWVVNGRLEDARFFFQEDRRLTLAQRREKLTHVTFHAKAGSFAEKCGRIEELAQRLTGLSGRFGAEASLDALRAAARLCKCDLTTGLVGEFPELQGIAGGLYARLETEEGLDRHPRGTAEAIYDHYRPTGSSDPLPLTIEGALLALCDRLDSLAVLAGAVGLPTGSRDPFALRRAASGIVRIAIDRRLDLSTNALVEAAVEVCTKGQGDRSALAAFLFERFRHRMGEEGYAYDTILAAMGQPAEAAPGELLWKLRDRVAAIHALRGPELAGLGEMQKRIVNILDQAAAATGATAPGGGAAAKSDPEESSAEASLLREIDRSEPVVSDLMARGEYEGALRAALAVRPALSAFFDHVLVMHPDGQTMKRRLALLERVKNLGMQYVDLKQLVVAREETRAQLEKLDTGGSG